MSNDTDQLVDAVFCGDEEATFERSTTDLADFVLAALAQRAPCPPFNDRGRDDNEVELAYDFLLAQRSGQLFNVVEAARRVNLRPDLAASRLARHIAEERVVLLPAHPDSAPQAHPKLHVIDLGWLAFVLGWRTRRQVLAPRTIGALMETVVVAEWLEFFHALGEEPRLSYWAAGEDGKEIDLMIEHDGVLRAIEVKATPAPVARHADGIRAWYGRFLKVIPAVIACRVPVPKELHHGIRAVPWRLQWPGRESMARATAARCEAANAGAPSAA